MNTKEHTHHKHSHLTERERRTLYEVMKYKTCSIAQLARELQRSHCTVYYELARNGVLPPKIKNQK